MKEITEKGYIHRVEIPIEEIEHVDFALCKEPKETISQYYNRQEKKPDVICNGGFFAMKTGETIFNYVDEHEVKSKNPLYPWGIGTTDNVNLVYGCVTDGTPYKDFICGYPVLVAGREIQSMWHPSEIAARNPRTAFGYNQDYVYIVVVDGRQTGKPGMTLDELAQYMMDIGCDHAINLDGGGSSRLHIKDRVVNSPIENRAVDSILAIYLKEEFKKESEPKKFEVGDIVYFNGGLTYSSSVGGASKKRDKAFCTVTKIVSAIHGVHLVSLNGESSVYGWSDLENIRKVTDEEQLILDIASKDIITDRHYWISVINGKVQASADNIKSLMENIHKKIKN